MGKSAMFLLLSAIMSLSMGCVHTTAKEKEPDAARRETLFIASSKAAHQAIPFSPGKNYAMTCIGAYTLINLGDKSLRLSGPIYVKILRVEKPAWAKVQLLGMEEPPFWVNLTATVRIEEITAEQVPSNKVTSEKPINANSPCMVPLFQAQGVIEATL